MNCEAGSLHPHRERLEEVDLKLASMTIMT